MIRSLTPANFSDTIVDRAWRLRMHAIPLSSTMQLSPRDAMWLVTDKGWKELRAMADYTSALELRGERRATLFNLPVRVTVYDPPETPDIELVMTPLLKERR